MRTDTERGAREPRGRGYRTPALAAGCVLSLVTGIACTTGSSEPEEIQGTSQSEPIDRGDVATTERDDLETVFTDAGVEGSFVLYDTGDRSAVVVGPEGARDRESPASTFKLPNTLIALQTGAVEDVDEVVPAADEDDSDQDMSLREALPDSNVPVYQEVARRIGSESMGTWVDRFDYGNRSVGEEEQVDTFWLEGPLEISPLEQTSFLASLARAELPVDVEHQEAVQEMTALEQGGDYSLHGKTGWATEADPEPGWWVGWVERGDDVHTFALRIEVESDEQLELHESLGRELLVELDALPPEAAN